MNDFKRGLKAGIPIALGYLSVSFTFGIAALGAGLSWQQATLISMLTLTSAGQFSGIRTMMVPGQYLTMVVSQLTINIRYSFMSISLSQKTDAKFKGIYRWLLGFFMTDEIFAVASTEKEVKRSFFFGLSILPLAGWTFGTLAGALLGNVLPHNVLSALGLAIYGMFVAIVIPEMKKGKNVCIVVLAAVALSCCFCLIPGLSSIPSGLSVSICAVAAAILGALLFPVKEEDTGGDA